VTPPPLPRVVARFLQARVSGSIDSNRNAPSVKIRPFPNSDRNDMDSQPFSVALQLIPLGLLSMGMGIVAYLLAREKGRNV
jgi:hypothetical protein